MKKIDVLCWGVKHIAANHNFDANVDYMENGEVCIFGGCNVPTLSDVQMLCSDLGIGREYIEHSDLGIDIWLPGDFTLDAEYDETGFEMWKRHGVAIGS